MLLLSFAGLARATDLPPSATLDLPIATNLATPAWLGHPDTPATSLATLNLPILTPDTNASLLVTVYFEEKEGGYMHVVWQGTQGAQVLSDNFYEGIGMANQRSLLLSPATLVGDGTLSFICSDATLGIKRIRLEWLESKTELVSPAVPDALVTPAIGSTVSAATMSGQPAGGQPGAWTGQLVNVPLDDEPTRIEEGVEFSIDLDKIPGLARISFKEAGLPMGQHLVVWVNEKRAGTITPSVPDLMDDGFLTNLTATTSYLGWRDASFYLPVSNLQDGVNTLQFSAESDGDPTTPAADASSSTSTTPLAIKALLMQLNYAPFAVKTGAPTFAIPSSPSQVTATDSPPVPTESSTP